MMTVLFALLDLFNIVIVFHVVSAENIGCGVAFEFFKASDGVAEYSLQNFNGTKEFFLN